MTPPPPPVNSAFVMLKNIIVAQNELLLKRVAEEAGIDEDYLKEKYIKPEYYLPIIKKTCQPLKPPQEHL